MAEPVIPLKIDLLRGSEVSSFRIVLGIIFFVVAAGWVSYKVLNNQPLVLFDAALFILFTLNGAFQIVEGAGISLSALVGQAYIIIDKEAVRVKPGVKSSEERIEWNAVKRLCIDGEMPELWHRDADKSSRIDLSKLSPEMRAVTRQTLKAIAREKNIALN